MTRQEIGTNGTQASVHIVLQGNGGVGKSFVSAILAQYFRTKSAPVHCLDTDPVNATFAQYRLLEAEHMKVLRRGTVNEKQFDVFVQKVCHGDGVFIVDTGATTFVPLWNYILENEILAFLRSHGRNVFVHSVVAGGQAMSDTLNGLERRSNREAPRSRYEIKAGWETPAVLEQSLKSDLPGELKALVTSNVYDTATGLYLLVPQGSRLVGRYDSRISYGQDGVQVAWSRIIYPDASSVDLDAMVGLDSHGNAGLRDKVDHHYSRLLGFSVLTSLFTAAFEISQRSSQSALTYPTPAQTAGSAVGQEVSQTGAQITRRNLNVQPRIKVPAGYKFTVRVNRDILFEAPYEPIQTNLAPRGHFKSPSAQGGLSR